MSPTPRGSVPPVLVFAFQTNQRANGGVTSLSHILASLVGHRPVVVTQRETPLTEAWRASGYEVHTVAMPKVAKDWTPAERLRAFARRAPAMMRGQFETAALVRRTDARVVHFNDSDSFAFGYFGARAAGASVVVVLRDTTGLERRTWRTIGRLADVVVTLSDDMARVYRERAVPTAMLVTIPSIVPVPSASPTRETARRELGFSPDAFVVVVVGAVIARKQQLELVRALGVAAAGWGDGATLVFVGDYRPDADDYCAACGRARDALPEPDRVSFVGFVEDPSAYYRAADVAVIGSETEGLARGMIEALSYGVPVVSTDVCSARDVLVRGDAGRVVPVHDFDAVVREVEALREQPAVRRELGANGVSYVREHFTAERIGGAYDALYATVVAAKRVGRRPASSTRSHE